MIIVQDRELEILRHRLTQRDVTVAEVHQYIQFQHTPMNGQVQQFLADFVSQQDLDNFWGLHDWWAPVPDKPTTLPLPSIIQFCWYVNYMPGTEPIDFNKAMFQFYNRAVEWLKLHNIDPQNPGETPEERRKRRNRERMAQVRGHRKVPEKQLKHDEGLLAQVRGLEAQIELLKQESKAKEEEIHAQVLGHQQRMMEASDRKKRTVQEYKARIETLQAEIRGLTQ